MAMPSRSSLLRALVSGALFAVACGRPETGPPPGPGETPPDAGGAPARFAAFASSFTRDALALSPPTATLYGLHRHRDVATGSEVRLDRELDDFSSDATAFKIRFYRAAFATLDREFPPASLSEEDRVDRRILASQCRLALLELEQTRAIATNPTLAIESIGTALFFPAVVDYAPLAERAQDVLARLEKVPAFVDQAIAALGDGPLVHVREAIDENEGNRDVLQNALPALFPERSDLRPRFEAARARAVEAIDRMRAYLLEAAARRPAGDWRLGPELYRQKFRATFGDGVEPRDVLRRAQESLALLREEMRLAAEPLHETYFAGHQGHSRLRDPRARADTIVREVLARIGKNHAPRDRLVEAIRSDVARISDFLEAHAIVSTTRPARLTVTETPRFLRGVYGVAGLHAAPPLEPDLPSFYYVTPIPADWTESKAEPKLREYNRSKLLLLSIHEALPGRATQLEYANRVHPEWRRVVRGVYGDGAYVEGWAQYAEEMMLEQGIADPDDPGMALTFKMEELRIAANAIIDIRLHTEGMTDKQAIDLMVRDTFQERAEAERKLLRARLTSCQLTACFVGWEAWRRLRQEVEAARGASFDLRAFHDEALTQGAIPLDALRTLLLGDEVGGAAPAR